MGRFGAADGLLQHLDSLDTLIESRLATGQLQVSCLNLFTVNLLVPTIPLSVLLVLAIKEVAKVLAVGISEV